MTSQPTGLLQSILFGEGFAFDLRPRRLRHRGHVLKLERIPLEILLLLLEHPGEIVTREEIVARIWGDGVFLDTDNSIRGAIRKIRHTLRDNREQPRFIQTVTGRGYRFIAPVIDRTAEEHGANVPMREEQELRTEPHLRRDLCDGTIAEDGFANSVDEQKSSPTIKPSVPLKSVEKRLSDRRSRLTAQLLVGFCVLAIIAVPIVIFLLRPAGGKHETPGRRVAEQRVTSNSSEAPVEFAVVSPDGKYVAYSDPGGVYLRAIASGETGRWDLPKNFIAKPNSWFQDGTHLLVTRSEGITPKLSLWKLSLLGGSPRKLIDNAGAGSVSPDGTRIAFVASLPSWGQAIWVMGADGSNPHKIAEATRPAAPGYLNRWILSLAWSPNSRRIAYMERYGVAGLAPASTDLSSLWTRDADGGDPQMIFKDAWLGPRLAWAPDGRILFGSRANPATERDDEGMRSIRVDEHTGRAIGQPQVLTEGAGTIGGVSVTSDGKRLVLWRTSLQYQAFISEYDANMRKWKTPRRLTLDANSNQATAWLPDSKTVLFVSNRNGTWTLFKQAIDETTADVLVEGHSLYLPRLSADGSQVLYGSQSDPANPSAPVSLMRFPVSGGPSQLVVRDVGLGNYQCARLPSTLCIIHKPERTDCIFFSFDPQRGIGRELLRSHDGCHDWSLSPDGRTLADFPDGHSIRLFSIEKGVAKADKTVIFKDWPVSYGDWTTDGSGILVSSHSPSGMPVVLEVNRTGKASVVLKSTASISYDYMIQSPDGHYAILGAAVPGDNNVWMIDKF